MTVLTLMIFSAAALAQGDCENHCRQTNPQEFGEQDFECSGRKKVSADWGNGNGSKRGKVSGVAPRPEQGHAFSSIS